METALGLVLIGALTSGAVEIAKRFKIKPQLALGVLSLIGAGLYLAFVSFLPDEAMGAIIAIWGSGNMFYELLLKRLPSKE